MTRLTIICISFIIVSLMFAGQSYAQIDSESVLGAWLLDEGAGDFTADASGNGNDGTLMGPPNWVAGNFGNALEFDGSSTYVDCGNAEALNVEVFSVSFWCNIPSTQSWNHMISRGQHNAGNPGGVNWGVMMVDNAEIILFETFTDTAWIGIRADTTTGEWHHVVATYDGDTMQLYHDGALAASTSGAGIVLGEDRPFIIGARSDAGSAGGFFIGSIDEVGYLNTILAPEDIGTIMNNGLAEITGGTPVAVKPQPADEATDVPRDVVLSWTPGEFVAATNGHKVYFGQSFNDVNDGIGAITQDANSYALAQRLDLDTTYYWRVDEVNAPPTSHIEFKGGVWSFTTEPIAYPVENITAIASSSYAADQGPENTINSLGLDVNDLLHSTEPADMWLSGSEPNGAWIEYELDKVYKLHEMWVWNHNGMMEFFLGFGLKDVTIEYSTNGTDYTTLGTTHEFARAPGTSDYAHNTTVDFGSVAAKYVRLTANSNWGGLRLQYGLSEVRFLYIPVHAREPSPDSGTTDVAVDVTLGFRAGREAAEHNVYLSTDEQVVIDGNVPVTTVTETSYDPLSLDLGTTYYWKINEVNMAETTTTWQGDIWNFTTSDSLVVEDFESYNDIVLGEEGSNLVYSTWIDGYANPAANGSTIGYVEAYQPSMETDTVHDGDQSVPFSYDNSTAGYSEATANIANLTIGGNWALHGIKSLSLWFYGDPNNALEQMYVKLNDVKVLYDSDAGNITKSSWQSWNINMADFAGVDLSNVIELSIGFERIGLSGGFGTVIFDDIRLYPYSRQLITPVQPDPAGLVGRWEFDGNYNDSSGNGRNGTPVGAISFETDPFRGQVLSLPGGDDQFVDLGSVGISGNMPRTIACWAKADNTSIPDWTLIFGFTGDAAGGGVDGSHFNIGSLGGPGGGVGAHCWGWEETIFSDEEALDWHHYAMTYDGTTIEYYGDGIPMDTDTGKSNVWDISASADRVHVGSRITQTSSFPGKVDDAQIFNRVLSDAEIAWLASRTLPFDKPF